MALPSPRLLWQALLGLPGQRGNVCLPCGAMCASPVGQCVPPLLPDHSSAPEGGTGQTTSGTQAHSSVPDSGAFALRHHRQQVITRGLLQREMFGSYLPWKTLLVLSLAVLHADFTETGAFADLSDCKSATIDDVNESLEKFSKCLPEMIAKGEKASINTLVWTLQETLDLLRPAQEQFCKQVPPCPRPVAPKNGGLVCVTIDNAQYCKPMCNKGYDFQFLRSSRLYEVCGNATGFSWTTQLVGGKALAVCNPSEMAISGAKSAYFPSYSSCVHTLASPETQAEQLNIFLKELAERGIDGSRRDQGADCVLCGY